MRTDILKNSRISYITHDLTAMFFRNMNDSFGQLALSYTKPTEEILDHGIKLNPSTHPVTNKLSFVQIFLIPLPFPILYPKCNQTNHTRIDGSG
jgi:hypothetical protein